MTDLDTRVRAAKAAERQAYRRRVEAEEAHLLTAIERVLSGELIAELGFVLGAHNSPTSAIVEFNYHGHSICLEKVDLDGSPPILEASSQRRGKASVRADNDLLIFLSRFVDD